MKILVVGGGSAGWSVASYLAAQTDCNITIIESDNIPIIGVGESTIPSIVDFMKDVGLTEQQLFEHCSAIRKYSIHHNNWNGSNHSWWHHFCFDESEHDEQISWLTSNTLPNKKHRHSYHLDATQLATTLKKLVGIPKGVNHVLDDVVDVTYNDHGVASVVGKKSIYTADLYIDCTGFKSLLRKPLGVVYKNHPGLINNCAVAGPADFTDPGANYTQTYAMDYGWRWRISLQHRTGNGYVFNKDIISVDQAIDEFIRKTPGLKKDKIFTVPFQNGFITEPWKKNVVSIGLSSGFLEPLESTGIFLIHSPLKLLKKLLNDPRGPEKFNRVWTNIYNHIGDFVSLHYKTSMLDHTEYWRSMPKIDKVRLPEKGQILFDQYSYRNLARSRNIKLE